MKCPRETVSDQKSKPNPDLNTEKSTLKSAREGQLWGSKTDLFLKDISKHNPARLKLFKRAFSGEGSPRDAIKAKCLECVDCDLGAVRDCTGYSCPLWKYRPFQRQGVV